MKDILNAPFLKEFEKTASNMYRLGWDERNGGNISYLLKEEEVAEYLDVHNVIRNIPLGGGSRFFFRRFPSCWQIFHRYRNWQIFQEC